MDEEESPPRPPPLTRFALYSLFSTMADFVYGAVFVTVLLGRGADPWVLGSVLAANTALGMVLEAPSGALGDRYGHRRLLWAGLGLWGAGFAVFGAAEGLAATALGLALGISGHSLQSGTLMALVINRIDGRDRTARVAGTVRIGQVAARGGSVLGAASVLVGGTWASPGTLVLTAGAVLVLLAVLTPLCFPASRGLPGRTITAILRESVATVAGRRFWPLVSLAVSTAIVLATLIVAWQPLLLSAHGEDVRRNGLVLLAMALGLMAGAACSRFVDQRRPHVWGPVFALATGVPLVLLGFGWLPLVVGLVAAEFCLGVAGVLSGAWQQLMYSDVNRNTMFSAMAVVSGGTVGLTQLVFGWLWELAGITAAITVTVAVSSVIALLTPLLARLFPTSVQWDTVPTGPDKDGHLA